MEGGRPLSSAVPIRDASRHYNSDWRRSTSRSSSPTSTESLRSGTPVAMAIPSVRQDYAPPPLPPPRSLDDLDHGIDVAWEWGNRETTEERARLPSIKPGSSLLGGYLPPHRNNSDTSRSELDEMDLDEAFGRRSSTVSTVRSPSLADIDLGHRFRNGVRRPSSPGAAANQRLHGERPLAQENLNRSSHAYDKHVLSKIGKSNSPPRHLRPDEADGMTLAQQLSLETSHGGVTRLSATDQPASATDSLSRWITTPSSAAVSPGFRAGWRDFSTDYPNSSLDSLPPTGTVDPDTVSRLRDGARPSTSGSVSAVDDAINPVSRSKRGAHHQPFSMDQENESRAEEITPFGRLHLRDGLMSRAEAQSSLSKSPMKRRAQSPPSEMARDDRGPGNPLEPYQRSSPAISNRSPTMRYYVKYGSVSSTASSVRQGSYASSAAISVAGSSMTSISSFDRPSPGGASPLDPQALTHTSPTLHVSSSSTMAQFRRPMSTLQEGKTVLSPHRAPLQVASLKNRPHGVTRIGDHWICECCPKKPKKFQTEDELRAHEMEKAYSCQFCPNRFKNKNEMERHQNSLHLRRHSWSCAAITSHQAAFHPSTAANSQSPVGPSYDTCGYCGEEFPNFPQPDWDRRVEHLSNIHKFGECNQAKKFFRADHFRQHLKHSHAGSSGKWTNMLENACMKDECSVDGVIMIGDSPTGSESSRGPTSLPAPGDAPMGGETITESQHES